MPLNILFHDEHYVAIDKPAGMLVHRTKMAAGERLFALQTLRDQIGQHVFPIHRLDKGTAGVLLFALSSDAARRMSEAFLDRTVIKTYEAIVRGWLENNGTIDYALKERLDKTTDGKSRVDKPAQNAITQFEIIQRTELNQPVGRYQTARYSLVRAVPQTGRKHQIRRHFKHIFHPILGDRKYGDRDHNAFAREILGVQRMMLIATDLEFRHPYSGNSIHLSSACSFPEAVSSWFKESTSI